jgi:hypothetical protein
MIRGFLLAVSVAMTAGAFQTLPPRPVMMRDLTVPVERLPAGCALASTPSVPVDGNRIRFGLWAGFPTNPWIGTDRQQVISIREFIDPPTRALPDGPPPDARALARYREQFANGVEEAYGAVYMQADADVVTVRGIRFAPGKQTSALGTGVSRNAERIRVEIGSIVAVVTGNGACFQTVGAYLKSLAN